MQNSVVRTVALSVGLWATACVAAAAADAVDVTVPAPIGVGPAEPSPFTWSGFYAGFNGGYGVSGDDDVEAQPFSTVDPILLGTLAPAGFLGGAQAGYNIQRGHAVFGIETDLQASGMRDETTAAAFDQTLGTGTTSLDWYGTLRARLGYAAGRDHFYVTGGLAYGGLDGVIDARGRDGFSASLTTPDEVAYGYSLGAGVEHAVNERVSLRGEYQFVHLGQTATGSVLDPTGADTGVVASSEVELKAHTFRVGLNFHF